MPPTKIYTLGKKTKLNLLGTLSLVVQGHCWNSLKILRIGVTLILIDMSASLVADPSKYKSTTALGKGHPYAINHLILP